VGGERVEAALDWLEKAQRPAAIALISSAILLSPGTRGGKEQNQSAHRRSGAIQPLVATWRAKLCASPDIVLAAVVGQAGAMKPIKSA
jgi:hypothetical protein